MIQVLPVRGIPEVRTGADIAELVLSALRAQGEGLGPGDVVVVTSKIVSKALGLTADVTVDRPSLVLQESDGVVAERATSTGYTRVVAAKAGPVMAGAGIDASNADDDVHLLLPHDPDAAAAALHEQFADRLGHRRFAVLLSDTSGRAWRSGLTDFALGSHGLTPLEDLRGCSDTHGRDLAVTVRNIADEVASAADLVKGKVDRVPVAIVRGLDARFIRPDAAGARSLVRSGSSDWFALGRAEAVRDALGVTAGSELSIEVGIESVHAEPLIERVRRAWSAATAPEVELEGAALDGGDGGWSVLSDDPYLLGRAVARFQVALAGERLTSRIARQGQGQIELDITERTFT